MTEKCKRNEIKKELIQKDFYTIDDLRMIMKLLRADDGCPWDREQSHETIRQDMLEEAYETAEAIDMNNKDMLCEELGDVLLQVAFHSEIAEESSEFTFDDVCTGVCKKMIERHPHVFGDVKVDSVENVLTNWDAIKQNSKSRETLSEQLDGVCKALPSLMLASKYVKKALKSGADFRYGLIEKDMNEHQVGDALFDIVVYCKKKGMDPELLLQRRCSEFLKNIEG